MNQQLVLQMSKIQEVVLKRAIVMLEGMKCSYAIIDPLGNKHGLLDVKEKPTNVRKYPHGERSRYTLSFIHLMQVGDVISIPFGKFKAEEVQVSVTSSANKAWGKGSLTTTLNRASQTVEVMRIL
jgi:hypothetical protein